MSEFKDHFSKQAEGYSKFRPLYPPALYQHLSDMCSGHMLVWDCATGSGQAARGLADFFEHIVATDASEKQILHAFGPDNVSYRVAGAEHSGLETSSVDLIAVAQALHWFDHDAFFTEVKRVLKPGGILAVWTYNLLHINDEIDRIIKKLDEDIICSYWPPERQLVRDKYRTIDFDFQEVSFPELNMNTTWALDELLGYLSTWSSVMRYKADKELDPLQEIYTDLCDAWGADTDKKIVRWPLSFRVGKY